MKRLFWALLILIFLFVMGGCVSLPNSNTSGESTANQETSHPVSSETASIQSSVMNAIQSASIYESETGTISEEDSIKAIEAVYSEAVSTDVFPNCTKDEYGVYMETDTGLDFVYCPIIEGLDSGDDDLEIVTLAPFDGENRSIANRFGYAHDLDAADNVAQLLDANEAMWRFDNNANLDDNEVTLDRILSLSDYKVILWHGHGGYTRKSGYFLCTNIVWTEELQSRYSLNKRTAFIYNGEYIGLRPAFFEENYPDGAFENAFIYLATCLSGKERDMAQVLINKGAAIVFVNSESIDRGYNLDMMHLIAESFFVGPSGPITRAAIAALGPQYSFTTQGNWFIEDSMLLAKTRYGKKDPNRLINAAEVYYVCNNESEYSFNYNTWMSGFRNTDISETIALPDGQYYGYMCWDSNNFFSSNESKAVLKLDIKTTAQELIDRNYTGELYIESKTIEDEDAPGYFMSWHVTVDKIERDGGRFILHGKSIYTGESLSFKEDENNFFLQTEYEIPFADFATITDYAFCIDYLYDNGISPNTISWNELGSYYTEYFCYDAFVTVVITDGEISKMAFEYSP